MATAAAVASAAIDPRLASFKTFSDRGGKFRVAVVNRCNFNCFFCHNEGMENPRQPGESGFKAKGCSTVPAQDLVELMNAYTGLGGKSLNVTGGEPTTRKDIVEVLSAIEKRDTTIVLNSNVSSPFVKRLLDVPKVPQVDAIFASLHTTDDRAFGDAMGTPFDKRGASSVMRNMVALKEHGYHVEINFSLGNYNKEEWEKVLRFGVDNGIATKAITLVRHDESEAFYRAKGSFIDPRFLEDSLERAGCTLVPTDPTKVGGYTEYFEAPCGVSVIVKNIARGRLRTSMCDGCTKRNECGEGVYALRSGVDGVWKPCLLDSSKLFPFKPRHGGQDGTTTPGEEEPRSWEDQILDAIHTMVGGSSWEFQTGAPR